MMAELVTPAPVSDALFDADEFYHWRDLWVDMPAFSADDETPFDNVNVQFSNAQDRREFMKLMGYPADRRRSIWYPPIEIRKHSVRNAPAVVVEPNKYPVYVISKGRSDKRLTADHLLKLGIPFRLVVEPQEYEDYAKHVAKEILLETPFSNLGQGSIPARNFVWEHSIELGADRHWILDDNINGFYRLHENAKAKVIDENPFISVENWVDRYENVPMSGLNYAFFAPDREKQPPFRLNRRVYSCILLSNHIPHRWRGRYNEDTDLSIRILKDGYCTILFNHYLIMKIPTMAMSGGNTDELYEQNDEFDGRLEMAKSLCEQHPDVARISWKWGRWQHHVNYEPFRRNQLVKGKPHKEANDGMGEDHSGTSDVPAAQAGGRVCGNVRGPRDEEGEKQASSGADLTLW